MYKVYIQNLSDASRTLIYQSDSTDSLIEKPKVTFEWGQPFTFSFFIHSDHPAYSSLTPMVTFVTIDSDDDEIFYGRVLTSDKDIFGKKEIYCEGALNFLSDSELSEYESTTSISSFFSNCVNQHNSQVESRKRFSVGTVEFTDTNVYFKHEDNVDPKSTLDEQLVKRFGGCITINKTQAGHSINYLKQVGETKTNLIRLGENVKDRTDHESGESIFSILRPIGGSNSGSHTPVTISENDGLIEIPAMIAKYGRIIKKETFSDRFTEEDLRAAAMSFIDRLGMNDDKPPITVDIGYVDFCYLNPSVGKIYFGDVFNDIEGYSGEAMVVGRMELDLSNPANDTLSLYNKTYLDSREYSPILSSSTGSALSGGGGGGGGGGGALAEALEEPFKKFQTFYTQTDEKFNWLATESEWDELAQAGRVTAFTELTRTARYVEDSAKIELPFEDWKAQTQAFDPTADVSEEAYRAWIAANPYAIYNTEYSDATRTERIISKTGIDSLGADETIMSRITQEAARVESSVYASQSQVYSSIGQTASDIRVDIANTEQNLYDYINMTASGIRQQIINAGNRTIVNDTDPRGSSYTPKDGDIWIESVHDGTWDGADGFDWIHDEDYDWTQVQGAKAWVWKNDQWQLVADRQQLVTYSDFVNTADILISQKISELANEQGQVEVYRSLIEQSAEQIRAEVYGATSDIYTYIHQTASSVSIAAGQRPTTVVQNSHTDGTPTSINGRGLKENDIWIDTADQDSWDAALDFNWNDDAGYNWNDLRSDKIYVYRNGAWQLAVDGTILAEDTDLQVERDRIALLARNIDTLDGYARENFAQVNVRANEIYSEVLDKTNNLGSSITQTATQIRSEVHAANSQIYSEIVQTASTILLHVENAVSDLGATLEVTAEDIRSAVYAAKSTLYTSITQTASSIRSEVASTTSDLYSSIMQTASAIKSEVYAAKSTLYTSITQTASQIRSEVASTTSSLRSSIKQNADDIELKVSKGDISSTINQTAQSVLISASKINLEGYVTADELSAVSGDFDKLIGGSTTADVLRASSLYASYLTVNGKMGAWTNPSMGDASVDGVVFTASELKLNHSHNIELSASEGVITVTIKGAQTADGTANFNIADTAYFKDAVSAAYDDGIAQFEQATVTLQGDSESVYATCGIYDEGGVNYYEAGTSKTYYVGDGGYVVGRGTSKYITAIGSTVYLKQHTSSDKPIATWYSIVSSPASPGITLYQKGVSDYYYTGNGSSGYLCGTAVSVTPINADSKKRLKSVTRYGAGTEDKTTYYTKKKEEEEESSETT